MRMKTRNRLLATVAAVLMVAALLAACSAGASNDGMNLYNQQNAPTAAPAATAIGTTSESAGSGSAVPAIDPGNAAASGKKIIYTVTMTIEAKDVVGAIDNISSSAAGCGGYVSRMSDQEEGREATSSITVRIPPEKLKEFMEHVGAMGRLLSREMSTDDVTAQYSDVQAKLINAEAQEAQLLEIMKQAVKIDDILKVRSELNQQEQEIEQLKGQIRLMDNQVGFSTVTINIQQPPLPAVVADDEADKATGVQFWGFQAVWQKIAKGFTDSFNWTLNAISWILMALSYIIVPVVLIAAVVFIIILIVKVSLRKKKKG
jgi:hypothetical protein